MLAAMPVTRIVLIHGAATTAAVWSGVRRGLSRSCPGVDVVAPQRAYSGDLAAEVGALSGLCDGALVAGVSGGATLGLALLAAGVPVRGAVLHEPAVGALVPGLLADVARGYAAGGVAGFGAALYGPGWDPSMAPADPEAVERDFTMFRAFEPDPGAILASPAAAWSVTTVGEFSPPARHEAARALQERAGLARHELAGCGHAVHLDDPDVFAAVIAKSVAGLDNPL